jgi:acyl-CoA synthetase (NDP forming)
MLLLFLQDLRSLRSEGRSREKDLFKLAKLYGIRIIGPNCLGIINNDSHRYACNGSFGLL